MFDDHILTKGADGPAVDYQSYVLPCYPVHQVKCPIALFLGGEDTVPDNEWLISQLCPEYVPEPASPLTTTTTSGTGSSSNSDEEDDSQYREQQPFHHHHQLLHPHHHNNHKYLHPHQRLWIPTLSPLASPAPSPISQPRKLKQAHFIQSSAGNVGNSPHLSQGGSVFLRSSSEGQQLQQYPERHHPSQHRLISAAVQKSSPICYVHVEDSYEHLDFMWATTAPERIFRRAFDLIRDHSVNDPQQIPASGLSLSQS